MPFLCRICDANIGQSSSSDKSKNDKDPPIGDNEDDADTASTSPRRCSFCLGLLDDDELLDQIADAVAQQLKLSGYESVNFVMALNMPSSCLLREAVVERRLGAGKWAPMCMSPKELLSRQLMAKIGKAISLRPSLNSDLTLTVTLQNDEFVQSDFDFLMLHFPQIFLDSGVSGSSKKRQRFGRFSSDQNGQLEEEDQQQMASSLLTKVKIKAVRDQLDAAIAHTYRMRACRQRCAFTVAFERDPVFIGGRYCKYSRALSQSPWCAANDAAEEEEGGGASMATAAAAAAAARPLQNGSVSETIAGTMVGHFRADSARFIAAGREDIDVRMLGTGRPFAVQLLNARKTACLRDAHSARAALATLEAAIGGGAERDVRVHALARVSAKQAQQLNVGQEEKRKTYAALCCSRVPLRDDAPLQALARLPFPVPIAQRTVVRVLKRRPLIDRKRHIYAMSAIRLDPYHFVLRLETQAGTYVKEFVHSDFGRTRPSLAELMGLPLGQLDILRLDVLGVDLQWPPPPP